MKKETKTKIKRFLCGLLGHKYKVMHTKYKKKEIVYVHKCVRCGEIKTVKKWNWSGFTGEVFKFRKYEPLPRVQCPLAENMVPGIIITSDKEDGNGIHKT